MVVLDPGGGEPAVARLDALVRGSGPAVEEEELHPRVASHALREDPEGARGRLDGNHPGAAREGVGASYDRAVSASLLDAPTRERFLGRIRALSPDARPRFGTLDASRMVCHLLDGLRIAFSELSPEPVRTPLKNAFGRWLVIWSPVPWPKGRVKAPPGFFTTVPSPRFEEDREALLAAVRRFEKPEEVAWGESPFLGRLDARAWAALNARHLEHHLGQFGV